MKWTMTNKTASRTHDTWYPQGSRGFTLLCHEVYITKGYRDNRFYHVYFPGDFGMVPGKHYSLEAAKRRCEKYLFEVWRELSLSLA